MNSDYDNDEYFPIYYGRKTPSNYVIASINKPITISSNSAIYFDDIQGTKSLRASILNNIFNIKTKSLIMVSYNFIANTDKGGYVGILPRLNGNVLKNYISQNYSKEGVYSNSSSFLLDTTKLATNYLDFIYVGSEVAKNFNGHVSIFSCNK